MLAYYYVDLLLYELLLILFKNSKAGRISYSTLLIAAVNAVLYEHMEPSLDKRLTLDLICGNTADL